MQGSLGASLVDSLGLAGLGSGSAASIQQIADAFLPIIPSSKPAPPTSSAKKGMTSGKFIVKFVTSKHAYLL